MFFRVKWYVFHLSIFNICRDIGEIRCVTVNRSWEVSLWIFFWLLEMYHNSDGSSLYSSSYSAHVNGKVPRGFNFQIVISIIFF